MMRGKTSLALCVRFGDGSARVSARRMRPADRWFNRLPIVRGAVNFVGSMIVGIECLLRSAEVAELGDQPSQATDPAPSSTLSRTAILLSLLVGIGLAVALFILLPALAADLTMFLLPVAEVSWLRSIIEGVLRLTIFVGYLALVSLMRDIRRTYMYHGAEHKTINCFEHGDPLTVDNIVRHSTRHNRCGTTFLFFVMVVSILVFSLTNFWLEPVVSNTFFRVLVRIALMPLVAGISYELLRLLARAPEVLPIRIMRAPGLALQRLTTREPDRAMIEVARDAFCAVMALDADPERGPVEFDQCYYVDIITQARAILGDVDPADLDWICARVLDCKRSQLATQRVITRDQADQILATATQRATGQPLAYIWQSAPFFGAEYRVTPDVLIPRMDTELLVQTALAHIRPNHRVLELCTGSGCVANALAVHSGATVTATDISAPALELARVNTQNRVELVESDLFEMLVDRRFDVIVANPPYVPSAVIDTLSAEVRAEPRIALDGGPDGLAFYRRIADAAPAHLSLYGKLVLEIGADQAEAVSTILRPNFCNITVLPDLDGHDRVVTADIKL